MTLLLRFKPCEPDHMTYPFIVTIILLVDFNLMGLII